MASIKRQYPLILIPGIACNKDAFAEQITGLSDLVDIIVPEINQYDAVEKMADAVLQQAPEKFYLGGFSLGGWVALRIAEIAAARIIKLVMICSAEYSFLPREPLRNALNIIKEQGYENYINQAYYLYIPEHRHDDLDLKRKILNMMRAEGETFAINGINALLNRKKPFSYTNLTDIPVLVIGGDDDPRVPVASHQKLASEIPGSKLVLVSKAGHFAPMEQPDKVNQILRNWIVDA